VSNKPSLATQAAPQVRRTAQARRWRTMSWLGIGVGIFLLIYYSTIFVFPFGTAIWLSFHNWDFIVEPKFIGLRNYQRMFSDPYFWKALGVTAVFSTVEISIGVALAILLAFMLSRLRGGLQRSLLALYYLPVITPSVVTILLWNWLYIPNGGALNGLLTSLGVPPQPFLNSPDQALYCIIVMVIWANVGGAAVLFLAGINDVPEELLEVAVLDGAGIWKQLWYIILPLIRPVIFYQVIVSVIGTVQMFEQFFLLPGPGFSTRTLAVYTYQLGFQTLNQGYGAAVSIFIFVLLLVATILQLRRYRIGFEY
jgi:multiple sugar transport system permease protein